MICLKCKENIPQESKWCPFCGQKIESDNEQVVNVDEINRTNTDNSRAFTGLQTKDNNNRKPKRKTAKVVRCCVFVGIALLLILAILFDLNEQAGRADIKTVYGDTKTTHFDAGAESSSAFKELAKERYGYCAVYERNRIDKDGNEITTAYCMSYINNIYIEIRVDQNNRATLLDYGQWEKESSSIYKLKSIDPNMSQRSFIFCGEYMIDFKSLSKEKIPITRLFSKQVNYDGKSWTFQLLGTYQNDEGILGKYKRDGFEIKMEAANGENYSFFVYDGQVTQFCYKLCENYSGRSNFDIFEYYFTKYAFIISPNDIDTKYLEKAIDYENTYPLTIERFFTE